MDAKLKKKWVKALRSGKFKQAREALHEESRGVARNCCLGVLCRISGLKPNWEEASGEFEFGGNGAYLPDDLLDRFGLTDAEQRTLAVLNDGDISEPHHGFKFIADYIEKNIGEG